MIAHLDENPCEALWVVVGKADVVSVQISTLGDYCRKRVSLQAIRRE